MIEPFPGMTPEQLRLWDLIYGEHYRSFEEAIRRFVQEQFRKTFESIIREVLTSEVTRMVSNLPQFKDLDYRLSALEDKIGRIESVIDSAAEEIRQEEEAAQSAPEPEPVVMESEPSKPRRSRKSRKKEAPVVDEIPPRDDEMELEEI